MQVTTKHSDNSKSWNYGSVADYVKSCCQPRAYEVDGVTEEAQCTADKVAAALGRLCELLIDQGRLTPPELAEVVGDSYNLETISVHH